MKRRIYDVEFRTNAIRLITDQGLSISRASQDLGVSKSCLYEWLKTDKPVNLGSGLPVHGKLKPDDDRVRALAKENEILRRERDILKKALAIFSSP
jgi:transposase